MNDNNSKKNRPKSQIMMPNSTSPLPSHGRKNGSSDSLPNHRYENEWEVRSKELAEAKTRVAQMEKTMRWWSDCTDNWRKKWSEVKTERNDLRKELRITKNQIGKLMKELSMSTRQQEEGMAGSEAVKNNGFTIYSNTPPGALALSIPASSKAPPPPSYHQHQIPAGFESKTTAQHPLPFPLSRKNAQAQTAALCSSQLSVIDKEIVSLLEEKVAHLTSKLDEVNRRLILERDEKAHLYLTIERLRRDLSDLHELYESLKNELCEANGKEFTESEVESYAEEETEEARLLEQLAQDGEEADELEEDDFDPEQETEEVDKHTPTADPQLHQNDSSEKVAQEMVPESVPSLSGLDGNEVQQVGESVEQEEMEEGRVSNSPQSQFLPPAAEASSASDTSHKQDLAASIQVEISAVHRKLDLMTFISDVTELVGGVPTTPTIDDTAVLAETGLAVLPVSSSNEVSPESTAESMLNTLEVLLETQGGGTEFPTSVIQNGRMGGDSGELADSSPKLVPPDHNSSPPPPLPTKSPPNSFPEGQDPEDGKAFPGDF